MLKKNSNIDWTFNQKKSKINNIETFCENGVCGLPFIKAEPNKSDKQVAIFNKMAEDARKISNHSVIIENFNLNNLPELNKININSSNKISYNKNKLINLNNTFF